MSAAPRHSRDSRKAALAVWMPWLAAPLFCLLPIGGCAVAGSMRHASAQAMLQPAAAPLPGPAVVSTLPHGANAPILTAARR